MLNADSLATVVIGILNTSHKQICPKHVRTYKREFIEHTLTEQLYLYTEQGRTPH